MKYFIQRGLNEYGPYTLADLQRYVAQGNIVMTDLTRSEGMTDWMPLSQVIGNIPVPVTAPGLPAGAYAGAAAYGPGAGTGVGAGPIPPDFHWALVLLIGIFTCGLFYWAWLIVEAAWIRKIKATSLGLLFAPLAFVCLFTSGFLYGFTQAMHPGLFNPIGSLFSLAGIVLYLVAVFTMRSDLENYYNTTENIHLRLNGVVTFFFAAYYFQHHLTRIAKWKKTGYLEPQQ